jgi:Fe-S-cluster containining protein
MRMNSDATLCLPLSRPYVARDGSPEIDRVDPAIFILRYFARCMECAFCNDVCCAHGCDVDLQREEAILRHAPELAVFLGIPRSEWFVGERVLDPDSPGGSYLATRVVNERCVFLAKSGRGCRVHSYALEAGLDYHDLKPLACWLFPLNTQSGLLTSNRAMPLYDDLVCKGQGPTYYEAVREELGHMFGRELLVELDLFCATTTDAGSQRKLPIVRE